MKPEGREIGLPEHICSLRKNCDEVEFPEGGSMRVTTVLMVAALLLTPALSAAAKNKKKQANRAMIERMEAVPCGARERGLAGLGSVFGSVGITHVNSDEKLCPQYLLRTDEMEYHIQSTDGKHPVILPVGKEGVFKIKKDRMLLKIPDGDRKTRSYQVVGMKPVTPDDSSSSYSSPEKSVGPEHKVPTQGAEIPKTPGNGTETNVNPIPR
jgi:hypothetical protein